MADYSGHFDPWATHLTDAWLRNGGRYCWGSTKTFDDEGWLTEVPKPFLGLLINGCMDGYARNRRYYLDRGEDFMWKRPMIRWNAKRQVWQMKGGYHFTDEKTREWLHRNGWLDEQYKLIRMFDGTPIYRQEELAI